MSFEGDAVWKAISGGLLAVCTVVGGLLLSVNSAVHEQGEQIAVLQSQITVMHELIMDRTRERYTATEAARDISRIEARLTRIEKRLDSIDSHD